ncbi:MAG: prepilin-type N-terminal cleavage/methylation domain-containing protein [Armatimonadota bacterium]|nr:prepilin-type N-terminal cleavage/methylation domain-containing protein [Armatimonadota bacterium]
MRGRPGERGFTLIELIMVIVILAILLALALPGYLSTRKKAYLAEAQQTLQEMRQAAWQHYVEKLTFSGVAVSVEPTDNWSFGYSECGDGQCTMIASGQPGSPVADATVIVTLYYTGAASVVSSGF